ncbi:hypothetical protein P7C73_g3652, partial [Tremellales sp. Uapishka_1]
MSHPSLPPYLTSGASSRAHHALLVKLNESSSVQEEEGILLQEIVRARQTLAGKPNMSKIAETLLILLNIAMIRTRLDESLEFALVPALQLAEGGKNVRDRRIGYLYLVESLPRGHELELMLINTIRKDLSSSTLSHVFLALNTIIKMPSSDLGPAVTPLLCSRTLLKHKDVAIRQRTLQALVGLHPLSTPFPLSMSRMLKMLGLEEDSSVISVLLRLVSGLLREGGYTCEKAGEREYLVEEILKVARANHVFPESQVALDVVKALKELLRGTEDESLGVKMVDDYLIEQLKGITSTQGWQGAFVLETCTIISIFPISTKLRSTILRLISKTLCSFSKKASTSKSPLLPTPNEHMLALECLHMLPKELWDGKLGEESMRNVMEGLNSPDGGIRRLTLRLLYRLSPELSRLTFENLVDSLETSTNLCLPLDVPLDASQGRKLMIAQKETASRALEVLEIQSSELEAGGAEFAQGLMRILTVVQSVVEDGSGWPEGVEGVKEIISLNPARFGSPFIKTIFADTAKPSTDLTMLRAYLVIGHRFETKDQSLSAIRSLLTSVSEIARSAQQIALSAVVGVICQKEELEMAEAAAVALEILGKVQDNEISTKSFIVQTMFIFENGHLNLVKEHLSSYTVGVQRKDRGVILLTDLDQIANVRKAVKSVYEAHTILKAADPSASPLPSLTAQSRLTASRQLRYDAYEPPRPSSKKKNRIREVEEGSDDEVLRSFTEYRHQPLLGAGDYALMDHHVEGGERGGGRRDQGATAAALAIQSQGESRQHPIPRLVLTRTLDHQALILAQMLPPASLGALKDLIKPLAEGSSPFTSALAATLHETADKEKQAEEAKNDQYKWDLWGQHVGTSQTAWLPPPVDPQLGMFGLQGVVPAEQWWAAGRK